jgi:hypothetical protein
LLHHSTQKNITKVVTTIDTSRIPFAAHLGSIQGFYIAQTRMALNERGASLNSQ